MGGDGALNGQQSRQSLAPREGLWQWRFVLLGLISCCSPPARLPKWPTCSTMPASRASTTRQAARTQGSTAPAALGHGETKRIAQALKQAAELALIDAGKPGITLITKDTGGSAGRRQAAAAGRARRRRRNDPGSASLPRSPGRQGVAQGRVNVIAFSSVSSVAGQGTYLLGFLPEEEVASVVRYAAKQGMRNMALLYPQTQYGRRSSRRSPARPAPVACKSPPPSAMRAARPAMPRPSASPRMSAIQAAPSMRSSCRKAARCCAALSTDSRAEGHYPAKSDDPRHRPVGRQCHARDADRARRLVCRRVARTGRNASTADIRGLRQQAAAHREPRL